MSERIHDAGDAGRGADGPDPDVSERLLDAVSDRSFTDWYAERQFERNILEGRPYFNGATPTPPPERHAPGKLLRCHRRVAYDRANAPKEGPAPAGLFRFGTAFEEDLVVPYLRDLVDDLDAYVANSIWIDETVEAPGGPFRLRGETDPAVVDAEGAPYLVTEVKTTGSLSSLDGPRPQHRAQLHAYLFALDREYDRPVRDGLLVYGCSETLDVRAFHVPFDESFWTERVLEWMRTQTTHQREGSLPAAEPAYEWECDTCPYRQRCGRTDVPFGHVGPTGLLPGVTDYRRERLREYLDAHADARLTPTLAAEHPSLAEAHGAHDWRCPDCGDTVAWDRFDTTDVRPEPPACPSCSSEGRYSELVGPDPDEQVGGIDDRDGISD